MGFLSKLKHHAQTLMGNHKEIIEETKLSAITDDLVKNDAIFDFAVKNIQHYITIIANAVFLDTDYSEIKNWNLDTGYDEQNNLTAWN